MQLDARLRAVANFVGEGKRAADIGTDHAYLAIALMRERKAVRVIASDKNEGPYEAAKRTVHEAGLGQDISVRIGDGLAPLQPGEVDTVCMAGMGGVLMCEILSAGTEVLGTVESMVLQPMNGAAELRRWLYEHQWYIADEALALADGRIYEILSARRGKRKMPEPLLLEIGPVLWEKKPELLRHHIERLLFQERSVAAGMEKSQRAKRSSKYKASLKKIKALEERLKW